MYLIFVIIAIVLFIFRRKIGDILNIPRAKVSYAKVLYKGHEIPTYGVLKLTNNDSRIVFETDNSTNTISLLVSPGIYESLSEGSVGVLMYTGNRLRKFHIDKKIPDIVKPMNKKRKSKQRGNYGKI